MAAKLDANEEVLADINIVPFVDIVLVLLIIFMVTARFIVTPAIKVELPKAVSEDTIDQDKPTLSVLMAADGTILFAGVMDKIAGKESAAVAPADLPATLLKIKAMFPDVQVTIQADKQVPHGRVIGLIDRVKQAGIASFAFNVDPSAVDMLDAPAAAPAGAPAAAPAAP